MNTLWIGIGAGVLGGILGSFTTMLVWRLHFEEKGIWWGRSRCPQCRRNLTAIELVPIFSWFLQRGRCKKCGKWISVFYPLTEVIFVLTFVLFGLKFWGETSLFWMGPSVFLLLVLWVYDARFLEVDRRISLPAIGIALLWAFLREETSSLLIGGIVGFGFYFLQYWLTMKLLKKPGVGLGDLELGLLMGLLLGWKLLLPALFLAYLLGTLWAVPLLVTGKASRKTALPMGAFLMPATLVFLYAGEEILNWYLQTTGWSGL
ncbi:MAG: prepilin peptidase [Candidatus Gracilibacteria bacterium]|nr:prepilin peptidase [Candidatus Gracilibacteria bacterium]